MPIKYVTFGLGLTIGSLGAYIIIQKSKPIEISPQLSQKPSIDTSQESILSKYGIPSELSQIINRQAYSLSYNHLLRNADWAIEHITKAEASTDVDRKKSKFKEDSQILKLFRSKMSDYQKSGFDRGHLVPAADVKTNQEALDETFYLSNMSPQVPAFNRKYWSYFEKFARNLVGN
jgi:endonuclease G